MISVEYEVACQTIGQLIGRQAELIATEEARAEPDTTKLSAAVAKRAELIAARESLEPSDSSAIKEALAKYGPLARGLQNRRE
ncbi:hypothetical protein [Burkholderia gladioli]|uniref:hypothetical protein n=1 Tax=Burkholderia gladioli TaxID=28095 RepID=UPI0016402990|nr:hypothetical protein [Burkholderia gladioli]